jgi:hypothetical protein
VGSLTSCNPIGFHGLLQGELYFTFYTRRKDNIKEHLYENRPEAEGSTEEVEAVSCSSAFGFAVQFCWNIQRAAYSDRK